MLNKRKKHLDIYLIIENCFLVLLGFYLLFAACGATTYRFNYPIDVEKWLLYIIAFMTIIKIGLYLRVNKTSLFENRNKSIKTSVFLIIACFIAIVYYMSYRSGGYRFLLYMGVLTVGVIGTDYRKVMRVHVFCVGLMVMSAFIAAQTGIIDNFVYLINGKINSSMGMVCTTDLASCFVYLAITIWMAWDNLNLRDSIIIGLLALLNAFIIAKSLTSTLISVFLLLSIIIEYLIEEKDIFFGKKRINRLLDLFLQFSFPFCALVTFFIEFLYYKKLKIGYMIDNFLHGRVQFWDRGLKKYGITFFGTSFNQIGNGGSTIKNPNYNFIDSTYVLIFLRYGLVLFVVITVLWVLMTNKSIKMGKKRLAIGMGLIAIHSFSEHHFPEINYNILVILPLSLLGIGCVYENNRLDNSITKKRIWDYAYAITGIISFVLVMFLGPYFLSLIRTIYNVTEKIEFRGKLKVICVFLMVLVLVSILLIHSLYQVINSVVYKINKQDNYNTKNLLKSLGLLIGTVMFFVIFVIFGKMIIFKYGDSYCRVIESEKKVLDIVSLEIDKNGGKLYSDEIPVLYSDTYKCLSRDFKIGDQLAFVPNSTVIMDSNYESINLLRSGFLFAEISGEHSLYTNDQSVIRALTDSGYHFTGYYSKKRIVDLEEMAELNKLERYDNGSIKIIGKDNSLIYGPYYDLRYGDYTISYDLSLSNIDSIDSLKDYKVCTLRVSTWWGDNIIKEIPVFRSQFDLEGRCVIEIPIYISESRGCEFLVFSEENNAIFVNEITCQRTPERDIRFTYDKYGRTIHEEYYDLNGNPLEIRGGYYGIDYTYNNPDIKMGPSFCQYLDIKGEPVDLIGGYSGVAKKYDVRRRIIRVEYYDKIGNRVTVGDGHFAEEYEYDDDNNIIEYRYYDSNDDPVLLEDGYFKKRIIYNNKNEIVCEKYYGVNDEPTLNLSGYAAIEYDYNESGCELCRRLYDTNGKLIVGDEGYAERRRTLDENGNLIRIEFFGTDNQRINLREGYAIIENQYDMYGNQICTSYYDVDEKNIVNTLGYSIVKKHYNNKNNIISEEFYDDKGKKITLGSGYSICKYQVDDNGNQIDIFYYNKNSIPVMCNGFYHRIHKEYNNKKQVIKESYYDTFDKPISCPEGYYSISREYDSDGNVVVLRYLNQNDEPILRTDGYSEIHYKYNNKNLAISANYYDANGDVTTLKAGYSMYECLYDSKGNQTDISYLDKTGNPVMVWGLYSKIHRNFDKYGNIVREEYLDESGDIIMREDGYAAIEMKYDNANNVIEQKYLDLEDDLSINSKGYAVLRREYDSQNRITKESYYGKNLKPIDSIDGVAVIEREYNSDGVLTKEIKYNEDNEIIE